MSSNKQFDCKGKLIKIMSESLNFKLITIQIYKMNIYKCKKIYYDLYWVFSIINNYCHKDLVMRWELIPFVYETSIY